MKTKLRNLEDAEYVSNIMSKIDLFDDLLRFDLNQENKEKDCINLKLEISDYAHEKRYCILKKDKEEMIISGKYNNKVRKFLKDLINEMRQEYVDEIIEK